MFRIVVFVAFLFAVTFAERDCGKTRNVKAKQNHTLAATGTSCSPSNYAFFKGYCYALIQTYANGEFGEHFCDTYDGHLASIHDIYENRFITNLGLPSSGAWIGLQKDPVDFCWTWTDGTENDYNHWTSRPSHETGPSSFAKIEQNGFWNYEEPGTGMYFVCKKPAV